MLLFTSNQRLVEEYSDPAGTWRRWLGPDIRMTAWWEDEKDPTGDIVAVLGQTAARLVDAKVLSVGDLVNRLVDDGALPVNDFGLVMVDEAHHLPDGLINVLKGSTARMFFATATPKSSRGDLRRIFPDYAASTLRSAAEDGAIAPVRLLTLLYNPGEAETVAAAAAAHFIRLGKQVGVYCLPGRRTEQAQKVADLINTSGANLRIQYRGIRTAMNWPAQLPAMPPTVKMMLRTVVL